MGMPRKPAVEVTSDARVYLVDDRNNEWRVHDICYGPPHELEAARLLSDVVSIIGHRSIRFWPHFIEPRSV